MLKARPTDRPPVKKNASDTVKAKKKNSIFNFAGNLIKNNILKIFIALFVMVFVTVILYPLFKNLNEYKPEIVAMLEDLTNKQASIGGDINLSIFPVPEMTIEDIKLIDIDENSNQDFLSLEKIRAKLTIWPFLMKMLPIFKGKIVIENGKKNLNFTDEDSYYGFGWSHNLWKLGIWSEGPISTLLFRTEENYGDIKLEISCRTYITEKNNNTELDIYVNNSFNKNIKLTNNNQDENIEILIEEELVENNEIIIDFNFKNPVSPYEVLESPDSRKLGILMKNIRMRPI